MNSPFLIRIWFNSMRLIILVLFIFFLAIRKLFFVGVVENTSMLPTLAHHDHVLICRYLPSWLVRKHQLVVCDTQYITQSQKLPKYIIKRIAGLPGDSIDFDINEIKEGMFLYNIVDKETKKHRYIVPNKQIFILSDGKGIDSRYWGPLPIASLNGIVILNLTKGKSDV